MGKYTGAFEPTFSNDLNLLKYPKIKEFDAVFLNNVCGMVHNDPEVREGILRFVREGGGIGGHHAVTFANNNWPEFADMMGGWAGAHHTEKQMIKVDDPNSPLTKSFGVRELRAHRRVLSVPAVVSVFAGQAAHPAQHRRREVRSRDGGQVLRAVHASGSGLRAGVDQACTARAARTSRRSGTRRSSTPTRAGRSICWRRSSTSSATSMRTRRRARSVREVTGRHHK